MPLFAEPFTTEQRRIVPIIAPLLRQLSTAPVSFSGDTRVTLPSSGGQIDLPRETFVTRPNIFAGPSPPTFTLPQTAAEQQVTTPLLSRAAQAELDSGGRSVGTPLTGQFGVPLAIGSLLFSGPSALRTLSGVLRGGVPTFSGGASIGSAGGAGLSLLGRAIGSPELSTAGEAVGGLSTLLGLADAFELFGATAAGPAAAAGSGAASGSFLSPLLSSLAPYALAAAPLAGLLLPRLFASKTTAEQKAIERGVTQRGMEALKTSELKEIMGVPEAVEQTVRQFPQIPRGNIEREIQEDYAQWISSQEALARSLGSGQNNFASILAAGGPVEARRAFIAGLPSYLRERGDTGEPLPSPLYQPPSPTTIASLAGSPSAERSTVERVIMGTGGGRDLQGRLAVQDALRRGVSEADILQSMSVSSPLFEQVRRGLATPEEVGLPRVAPTGLSRRLLLEQTVPGIGRMVELITGAQQVGDLERLFTLMQSGLTLERAQARFRDEIAQRAARVAQEQEQLTTYNL